MTKKKNVTGKKTAVAPKVSKFKTLTTAIALSTVLVGCAKDLPEKEPDSFATDVRSMNSVANAEIIIETIAADTTTMPMRAGVENLEEGQVTGVSALASSRFFKTKIVSSNDGQYDDFVKDLTINASGIGKRFKVTFKLTHDFLVGYIESADKTQTGLNNRYLPSTAKEYTKIPLFQYSVSSFGIKENIKNDLNEETRNIKFTETNRSTAKFFRLSPVAENRQMTGLLGLDVEEAQEIYNRERLEDTIWTVKRARSILNRQDILKRSKQDGHIFKGTDFLRIKQDATNKLVFLRPVHLNDLTDVEKKILQNRSNDFTVVACDEEIAKAVEIAVNKCFLRAEFTQAIDNVRFVYDRDQEDGNLLARIKVDSSNVKAEDTPFIRISTDANPTAVITTNDDISGETRLKISKFANKEFMYRRVLEDSPNLFNITFAGQSGNSNVILVKFEFERDRLVIKRSRPLLGKTGTTEVDREIIMQFPVNYRKEVKYSSTGQKLKTTRYEVASHKDPQAVALVDLSKNQAPRIFSALDYYYAEQCFAGGVGSKEAIDIAHTADGKNDVLNYTIKNTYVNGRGYDCAGVNDERYFDVPNAHRTLTFKERISFKKYEGVDEVPFLNIPYDVQQKFNYGVFTSTKELPAEGDYSESTNTYKSVKHLPNIFDVRNGKQITYVLAGIPSSRKDIDGNPRALNKVELDLRNKLISSSKKVIADLNEGFKRAFKGTEFERAEDVIVLKIEQDTLIPEGTANYNGLEVVEKGHMGDLNRNYIYWIEKGTANSIIGLGGPTFNPRNGFVESANVYLYGGNMKGMIDHFVKSAEAEKKLVKDMAVPKDWQVFKEPTPAPTTAPATADSGEEVEVETETTPANATEAVGKGEETAARTGAMLAVSRDDANVVSRIRNLFNSQVNEEEISTQDYVTTRSSAFMKDIDKAHDFGKNGFGIKAKLNRSLFKKFNSEEHADRALNLAKAFKYANNPILRTRAIYGENSPEAKREELIARLQWKNFPKTNANGEMEEFFAKKKTHEDVSRTCVHRKGKFVLSNLQANYDVIEKAKTDIGKNDILIDIWMPTLAHEIGHNLGLRHNFIGSFDKKNWRFKTGDKDATRTSSSVMDYTTDDHATYDGLGPYDVYAIRAAYTGYVELDGMFDNDDKTVSTPFGTLNVKTVAENIDGKTKYRRLAKIVDIMKLMKVENYNQVKRKDIAKFKLENIKFCSDERAGDSPQCNRFDYGGSFKEIVDHEIKDYRLLYDLIYFAKDRKQFKIRDYSNYLVRKFSKLRMLNEEMWFKFIFEAPSEEDFETKAEYTKADEEFNAVIGDMVGAIQKSMDFFKSVVSTPNQVKYQKDNDVENRFMPAIVTDVVQSPLPGLPNQEVQKMIKVETKALETELLNPQDDDALVQGVDSDKVAAILAMTAERSWSWKYLMHSLKIPYTLVEKFIFRVETEDSQILSTLEEVIMDEVTPRALDGDTLYDLDKNAFTVDVNEYVRNYAIYGAMYFMNIKTYEPSFNPSRSFRVKGFTQENLPEGVPFVDITDGDLKYVPYAADSFAAQRMVEKGNALRVLTKSELPGLMEAWAQYLAQIPGFLDQVPPAKEFDAEVEKATIETLNKAVEEGDFQAIVNNNATLAGLYKAVLFDENSTMEQKIEAYTKLDALGKTITNQLLSKQFKDAVANIGLEGLTIEHVDGFIRNSVVSTILAKEECVADKTKCSAAEKSYLQGIKNTSHQDEFLRTLTKKELNELANVEYIRDDNGNVQGVNLFAPIVSMALAQVDLSLIVPREPSEGETPEQTAKLDEEYKKTINQYKPDTSASSKYDRIKANLGELAEIFFMLHEMENQQ